jgi:hypothetical protein
MTNNNINLQKNVFSEILSILQKYRIRQEMKNDGNDRHYAILSQTSPNPYGGDVLGPESEIPEDVINIVKVLKKIVFNFNKNNLYDRDWFNFIQPVANRYNKIIVSIDYRNITIQINIPFVDNNTVYYIDNISFFSLEDLAKSNRYNNNDFKDKLQNLGFTFKSNPSLLFVLESFLSNREEIVLSYFFDSIRGHYFALQPKLLNNNKNNNNNNKGDDNEFKINISEYLRENDSSSIEIEPNNNNEKKNWILKFHYLIILIILIKLISTIIFHKKLKK